MTKTPKRPRDPNQLARRIVDIATGEVADDPAPTSMAAGISDRLWEMADLVAVVQAAEAKPGKRGAYKKRDKA